MLKTEKKVLGQLLGYGGCSLNFAGFKQGDIKGLKGSKLVNTVVLPEPVIFSGQNGLEKIGGYPPQGDRPASPKGHESLSCNGINFRLGDIHDPGKGLGQFGQISGCYQNQQTYTQGRQSRNKNSAVEKKSGQPQQKGKRFHGVPSASFWASCQTAHSRPLTKTTRRSPWSSNSNPIRI